MATQRSRAAARRAEGRQGLMLAALLFAALGCSRPPALGAGQPPAQEEQGMHQLDCAEARRALLQRDFHHWRGLDVECPTAELLGLEPAPFEGLPRLLVGESRRSLRVQLLPWAGYARPRACFEQPGRLLFVDADRPELEEPAAQGSAAADPIRAATALREAFGPPAAQLDWHAGLLPVAGGEWVYPERGITLFWNTTRDILLHVQLYAPTDLATYRRTLRLDLQLHRRPLR